MSAPWGSIITAANDTLGGIATARVSNVAANNAWKRQKRALQNQIRWRVADLRAAGLNPILAATSFGGGGAPAPVMPQVPNFGESTARGARAGAEVGLKRKQERVAETQASANSAVAHAQSAKAALDAEATNTQKAQQLYYTEQANASAANARVASENAKIIQSQLPRARAVADMWQDPTMRRFMQAKEFFGTSSPLGLIGTGSSGSGMKVRDFMKHQRDTRSLQERRNDRMLNDYRYRRPKGRDER